MDDRLAQIRTRVDAATKGPWTSGGSYAGPWTEDDPPKPNYWRCWPWDAEANDVTDLAIVDTVHEVDAEFIAEARSDVPWLLSEVDRLRGQLVQARRLAVTVRNFLAADFAAHEVDDLVKHKIYDDLGTLVDRQAKWVPKVEGNQWGIERNPDVDENLRQDLARIREAERSVDLNVRIGD